MHPAVRAFLDAAMRVAPRSASAHDPLPGVLSEIGAMLEAGDLGVLLAGDGRDLAEVALVREGVRGDVP